MFLAKKNSLLVIIINSQHSKPIGIRYSSMIQRPTAPNITLDNENQNITNGGGVLRIFLIKIIDIEIDMAAINDKNTPNNVDDQSLINDSVDVDECKCCVDIVDVTTSFNSSGIVNGSEVNKLLMTFK